MLMRLMSKGEYLIVPKGTKFTGSGKLGLISHFLLYLQNYKEFETEILDLQSEKYGLSFEIKKYTTSGWALGDENVIGIRAFKI